MNWKRVRKERQRIAEDHISHLYTLAVASMDDHPQRSARYIALLRAISKKHKVTLPRGLKKGICKECNMPLIPGKNATVRTRNASVVVTCGNCGAIKRYPFRKERAARRAVRVGFFEKKTPGGLLQASVTCSGGRISSISLSGDFFLHPEGALHELEGLLKYKDPSAVGAIVSDFFSDSGIDMPGVTPSDMEDVISGALRVASHKSE